MRHHDERHEDAEARSHEHHGYGRGAADEGQDPRGGGRDRRRGRGFGRRFGAEGPGGLGAGGFGPGRSFGPEGGFGPGRGFGPGLGGPRGRRGRPRGDVRAAVLLLLDEGPRHGYQLIQDIGERSGGLWTPSPGSIYPTLSALEDEGLVVVEPVDGRKTAALTDAGRSHVAENRAQLGTPWVVPGEDEAGVSELREALGSLIEATRQVGRVGTPAQRSAATARLTEARTALYRVLAEEPEG